MIPKLETSYLGLTLKSPFLVGASPLVDNLEKVLCLEKAGASAIVMHSLFEEQLSRDAEAAVAHLEMQLDSNAEALSYLPESNDYHFDPADYLSQISRIKNQVKIPVIGSLNGRTVGGWVDYAVQIEQAGADALELNLYDVPTDPEVSGAELEERLFQIVGSVRKQLSIPLAVKLGAFYTSIPHVVRRLEELGADGVVLFNRFYQPDLNIEDLSVEPRLYLSTSAELLLRLRWMAILYGRYGLSLGLSGGIHHVQDAVKGIMAGADTLQVVSLLLRQGPNALAELIKGFAGWMVDHEYSDISEMRGCLSSRNCPDPSEFERANYLRILQLWKE